MSCPRQFASEIALSEHRVLVSEEIDGSLPFFKSETQQIFRPERFSTLRRKRVEARR